MKTILLIESDPFRKSFIEESLKQENVKFFWIDNPSGSDFMIADINPDLIMYSMDTFSQNWSEFEKSFLNFKFLLISETQIPGRFTLQVPFSHKDVVQAVRQALS